MLRDGDTGVREHAVNHILATRARGVPGELRQFVRPKINFSAASLTELVQWDEAITEPPLTMELSDNALRDAVEAPLTFPPYPCHSQAVERWVAEVTVCRQEGRPRRTPSFYSSTSAVESRTKAHVDKV